MTRSITLLVQTPSLSKCKVVNAHKLKAYGPTEVLTTLYQLCITINVSEVNNRILTSFFNRNFCARSKGGKGGRAGGKGGPAR